MGWNENQKRKDYVWNENRSYWVIYSSTIIELGVDLNTESCMNARMKAFHVYDQQAGVHSLKLRL